MNNATNGHYKLRFHVQDYFGSNREVFFPQPEIVFKVDQNQVHDHFHIPLVTTPWTYATYLNAGEDDRIDGNDENDGNDGNRPAFITAVLTALVFMLMN